MFEILRGLMAKRFKRLADDIRRRVECFDGNDAYVWYAAMTETSKAIRWAESSQAKLIIAVI
jgi:hypothetical protein